MIAIDPANASEILEEIFKEEKSEEYWRLRVLGEDGMCMSLGNVANELVGIASRVELEMMNYHRKRNVELVDRLEGMDEKEMQIVFDWQKESWDSFAHAHQMILLALILGSLVPEIGFFAMANEIPVFEAILRFLVDEIDRKKCLLLLLDHIYDVQKSLWLNYDENWERKIRSEKEDARKIGHEKREECALELLISILKHCSNFKILNSKSACDLLLKIKNDLKAKEKLVPKTIQALALLNFNLNQSENHFSDYLFASISKETYLGGTLVRTFNDISGKDKKTETAFIFLFLQIFKQEEPYRFLDTNDFSVLFSISLRRLQRTNPDDMIACDYLNLMLSSLDYETNLGSQPCKYLYDEVIEVIKMIINNESTIPAIRSSAFELLKHDSFL